MDPRLVKWVAAVALAAAAGCGGGSDERTSSAPVTTQTEPTERPATAAERKAVAATVHRYLSALRARDAKRYCSAFTQEQRDFIAQSHGGDDCASGQRKAWEDATGQFGRSQLKRLYAAYSKSKVFDVRVTGDRANAGLDVPPEVGPALSADSVTLSREGGRWLIADELGSE